jgi:hypothetical protein
LPPLIWQNGSLHCLTMQLPEGVLNMEAWHEREAQPARGLVQERNQPAPRRTWR